MGWNDQNPLPTDVICTVSAPTRGTQIEIDKLPDGMYRATAGNLFQSQEIGRSRELEPLLRKMNKLIWRE